MIKASAMFVVVAMASSKDRETFVCTAKLAEQAERYDEMVEGMKNVAKLDVELTVEERNLLSVGYKNVIGARRASWRIMSSIKHKEESNGNEQHVKRIKEYRNKVETKSVQTNILPGDIAEGAVWTRLLATLV